MLIAAYDLDLFADYHQVHVTDLRYDGDPGALWTADAARDMLAVGPDIIAFTTARDMGTHVRVELHNGVPDVVPDDWDQIAECFINCPSGGLRIMGCSDYGPEAFTLETPSTRMSMRILWGDLTRVSEDGLDGDDRYHVQLWSGEPHGTSYIKRLTAQDIPCSIQHEKN